MKKSILAALLVSVALCGTAAAKDEIVISTGVNMVAGKFDPTTGHGVWGPDIFHCHLVKVGADNKLELDLATAEKVSEDGATYTYEIRKDAKFADGAPLTAKDVVFTFEKA
ncbi:MAG: ABC transporter substrate-binding protein, partial [Pyramidobacter sp.]|nr:ABC transporter substrate-binding protein [Pyramidobacter sp.]